MYYIMCLLAFLCRDRAAEALDGKWVRERGNDAAQGHGMESNLAHRSKDTTTVHREAPALPTELPGHPRYLVIIIVYHAANCACQDFWVFFLKSQRQTLRQIYL